MSTIQRQIVWCAGFAFLIACLFSVIFFMVFPPADWSELWDRHFMDIPIVIFVPASSIVIGVLFGILSGLFWKKQFQFVDDTLHGLEEGKYMDHKDVPSIGELQSIAARIIKLVNKCLNKQNVHNA